MVKVLAAMVLVGAALVAVVPSAGSDAGSSAVVPRGGAYQGTTSQGKVLTFTVREQRVRSFATSVKLVCRVSGEYRDTRPFRPPGSVRIRSDGTFSRTVSPGDGTTYRYSGRFPSRSQGRGSLSMGSSKIVYGGVEVCATRGTVTWQASRRN